MDFRIRQGNDPSRVLVRDGATLQAEQRLRPQELPVRIGRLRHDLVGVVYYWELT